MAIDIDEPPTHYVMRKPSADARPEDGGNNLRQPIFTWIPT